MDYLGIEYRKWLDSLKVGDKVAIKESKYTSERVVFTEIVTITPKRAMRVKLNMLDSSDLFKDGRYNSGDKWMSTTMTIIPITPELIQQEERKKKATKLKEFFHWDKLDSETVDKVYGLVFKTKDKMQEAEPAIVHLADPANPQRFGISGMESKTVCGVIIKEGMLAKDIEEPVQKVTCIDCLHAEINRLNGIMETAGIV